jgi:hypothetical protein
MTSLLLAVLIPFLFWDKDPSTADALKRSHIASISVPEPLAASWRTVGGIAVESIEIAKFTRVLTPSLARRAPNVAGATQIPWVNSNGWKFLQDPLGSYVYHAAGPAAALAAAESFAYSVRSAIRTDEAGLAPLGKMLGFLRQRTGTKYPSLANVGFVDDHTKASAEFMNLLLRRNLLFQVVHKPNPGMALNVALGTPAYPRSEAGNPNLLAEKVRANLTDAKRPLRIYGSNTILGRLEGINGAARLYLINYGGAAYPIHGLRIRIGGRYAHQTAAIYGVETPKLADVRLFQEATEFTIGDMQLFAIIDLSR